MPLQNRVDPWGRIHAVAQRGSLMGNRGGCMHDAERRLVRRWAGKAWITCRLAFKDYRRPGLMTPGLYTELFFLDEATALAAGHRPCALCRRADYEAFKAAFARGAAARGVTVRRAGDMDAVLHAERVSEARAVARCADLPDAAMVEIGGRAWRVDSGRVRAWSWDGYGAAADAPEGAVSVLTPAGTVAALREGYAVRDG